VGIAIVFWNLFPWAPPPHIRRSLQLGEEYSKDERPWWLDSEARWPPKRPPVNESWLELQRDLEEQRAILHPPHILVGGRWVENKTVIPPERVAEWLREHGQNPWKRPRWMGRLMSGRSSAGSLLQLFDYKAPNTVLSHYSARVRGWRGEWLEDWEG
jgi:hypothetical protein